MKMLLDTHVLLWYVMGDARLSQRARDIIEAKSNLSFSVASLWEIAIKTNIRKLQLNCSFDDLLTRLDYIQAEILPISVDDTKIYPSFPSSRLGMPSRKLPLPTTALRKLELLAKDYQTGTW